MVSTMTSYSSWRHGAFLFLGNIRLKAISNSHQWPKHSWWAVFSSSAKQCLLSVNLKPFLMQTEQQTQKHRIVNPQRGRFDAKKMETASTNSGAEGTSLNEFRMLKYFKSKWKRFWIISLNIWANSAVTKHVLLAAEFIPYRPKLLDFHSLHVNAMKCIYVGFSLSKLQSFFWKISLNSRLIRLEGFNKEISPILSVRTTWPGDKALSRCVEGPEVESVQNLFLIASFLFFFFFLFI